MTLKEIYSKLTDKELLERFENMGTYTEEAREIISREIIFRKLKSSEEIDSLLQKRIELSKKIEEKNNIIAKNILLIILFIIFISIIAFVFFKMIDKIGKLIPYDPIGTLFIYFIASIPELLYFLLKLLD